MAVANSPSTCPDCGDAIRARATSCACGWRRQANGKGDEIQLHCAWNDHGIVCDRRGSVSDALNGRGPWYCSNHYWHGLRGIQKQATKAPTLSYRERWYRQHHLPYEHATGGLKVPALPARRSASREPGEDELFVQSDAA